MRLDIKNQTSFADTAVPTAEMEDLIGVQIGHFDRRWPGASSVVHDLIDTGFYLALVDSLPEAPGALGYHDVDAEGRPYSRVAVNPSLDNGSDWLTGPYSVVSIVGHEALETIGDPLCTIWRATGDQNVLTAQEVCDAVEATGYRHNGADLTNFLLPAWFNPFGQYPYDYLGQLAAPFTMTPGGYTLVSSGGRIQRSFAAETPAWRKVGRTRAALRGLVA